MYVVVVRICCCFRCRASVLLYAVCCAASEIHNAQHVLFTNIIYVLNPKKVARELQ